MSSGVIHTCDICGKTATPVLDTDAKWTKEYISVSFGSHPDQDPKDVLGVIAGRSFDVCRACFEITLAWFANYARQRIDYRPTNYTATVTPGAPAKGKRKR